MNRPVLDKQDMYRRLAAGEFGNTNASWRDISEWGMSTMAYPWCNQKLWGVRHTRVSGWPGTKLNVPTADVRDVINAGNFGPDYNISPMVPTGIYWEGDVSKDELDRVYCSGTPRPESGTWRKHMLKPRLYEGSAALVLLKTVCNPNSYKDVMKLLDDYPGHVVEFTALDVCFGTVPGRNCVIWELRKY